MSATVDFKLRRLAAEGEDGAGEAVETFELLLSRPIGINAEGESWRKASC